MQEVSAKRAAKEMKSHKSALITLDHHRLVAQSNEFT
jgi:hypothetical protein